MAYKFQLGTAVLSGSVVQSNGSLSALATDVESLDVQNGGITNAGAIAGVTTVSGSGKFQMESFAVGGTDVTSTAAELNILDGVTANKDEINFLDGATSGAAVAGKALVVDESSDIDSIGNLGATQLSASAAVLAGGDITGSSGLFIGGLADFQDSIAMVGTTVIDSNRAVSATALSGALEYSLSSGNGIQTFSFSNTANASFQIQLDAGANPGLEVDSNGLKVKISGSTGLSKDAGGLKLASIPNASLANSSVSFGGVSVSLGSSDATPAFDLSDATGYTGDTSLVTVGALDAGSITSNFGSINVGSSAITTTGTGSFGKVVISGDLEVQGSTTTIDSTTINISSSFTFEGPADDHETILHAGSPVADTTIYLPELSAGSYYLPAFEADPAGTSLSVTPDELNLLDGGTAVGSSITIADTDGFIVNDNGTMKSIPASDIKDYAAAASALSVASKADGDTLATGMNYFADLSANATVTLPASPSAGDLLYIKAKNLTGGAGITVNRAGSQLIDGETALLLESPYASVTLVYVATNDWRIV